jgi:hypothetical protein
MLGEKQHEERIDEDTYPVDDGGEKEYVHWFWEALVQIKHIPHPTWRGFHRSHDREKKWKVQSIVVIYQLFKTIPYTALAPEID